MGLRKGDVAVAVLVGAAQLAGTAAAARHQGDARSLSALGVALLLAGPASLTMLRRRPEISLAVTLASMISYLALDFPVGPVFLSLVICLVRCVFTRRRLAAGIGAAAFLLSLSLAVASGEVGWGEVAGATAWLLAILAVSEVVRSRRDAAAQAREAAVAEQRRRSGEERLLVARELHDVLAHSISLISVQAGVGLHLMDAEPEQARKALLAIREASQDGLRDLRRTIGVLRENASLTPTPDLGDLDRLLDGVRASGLDVTCEQVGQARPLDAPVELAAYRIVQEGLTNVTRHAGRKAARVRLSYGADSLEIRVDDDGPSVAATAPRGAGHGLQGMRERVAALGGELTAGPRPDGGFALCARIPA